MRAADVFSPGELQLSYSEWQSVVADRELGAVGAGWLRAWDVLDLMLSPMDDSRRKLLRYGHYLGYMAAAEALR